MALFLYLCLLCFSLTEAQVFSLGKCPEVKTQESFNITKYMGTWYEILRFPTSFEDGERCTTANYTLKENGHVQVINFGYDQKSGRAIQAEADGFVPDKNEPAKLLIKFANNAPYSKYWIINTDYENYTFIFSCTDLAGLSHIEFAWILSRKRVLDDNTKSKLFQEAETFGIKTSNFLISDQNGC